MHTTVKKIKSSVQAWQDYSRYDAHAKESNLFSTQPIWVQATNSHTCSQGVVHSKAETPQTCVVQTPQRETGYN